MTSVNLDSGLSGLSASLQHGSVGGTRAHLKRPPNTGGDNSIENLTSQELTARRSRGNPTLLPYPAGKNSVPPAFVPATPIGENIQLLPYPTGKDNITPVLPHPTEEDNITPILLRLPPYPTGKDNITPTGKDDITPVLLSVPPWNTDDASTTPMTDNISALPSGEIGPLLQSNGENISLLPYRIAMNNAAHQWSRSTSSWLG
jgi:hypothetical protein